MKTNKKLVAGALIIATVGVISSCNQQSPANNNVVATDSTSVCSALIAYVDVDSILVNYKLAIELGEAIEKKHANMRTKLEREAASLQKDAETFQDKLQKGIFLTQQRAEEEQQRLLMRQREFENLQADYSNQLASEQQNMNVQLYEKISAYINKYNTPERYKFILTRSLGGNMWYANESFNITQDIINGLNEEYNADSKSASKKK